MRADQLGPHGDTAVVGAELADGEIGRLVHVEQPSHQHAGAPLRDGVAVETGHAAVGAEDPVRLVARAGEDLRVGGAGRGGAFAEPEEIPRVAVWAGGLFVKRDVADDAGLFGEHVELAFQ